jgi:flagellar assembly protein FliH
MTAEEATRALDEAEIASIVRLAGQGSYQPDTRIAQRKPAAFRSRSLLDIARQATPEPPPAPKAAPAAAPTPAPTLAPTPAPAAPELRAASVVAEAEVVAEFPAASPAAPEPAPLPSPAPPGIDPEQAAREREEAYISGFRAGEAQARREIEGETVAALAALDAAARAFMNPDAAMVATLQSGLRAAVLGLASARAGARIDEMPDAFLRRIEALVEQVQSDLRGTVLRLNPADAAALGPLIGRSEMLSEARILAREDLNRGDVDLSIGGLRIVDALPLRPEPAAPEAAPEAAPDEGPAA